MLVGQENMEYYLGEQAKDPLHNLIPWHRYTKDLKPYSEVVLVTPSMATELLQCVSPSRPIRRTRVDKFIEDIKDAKVVLGNWTIAIDSFGALIDGRHRLKAIEETNYAVPININFNCQVDEMQEPIILPKPKERQRTIDDPWEP